MLCLTIVLEEYDKIALFSRGPVWCYIEMTRIGNTRYSPTWNGQEAYMAHIVWREVVQASD